MLINNSRGSEWQKCDLHLHSIASDGSATPEELVDEAIIKDVKIIALTDHHTVDNIDRIKNYAKDKDVTVISGVEFRTEYGQKSVHMIGLFPETYNGITLNQNAIYDLILSPLNLTRTLIIKKGKRNNPEYDDGKAFKEGLLKVQVDFKEAADLIHKYGGIVTVHAGGKTNSFDEEMKHEGSSKKNVTVADSLGPVKEELLNNYIDICEVRNAKEADFYLKEWNKPCIAASDAHCISNVACNYCWIKCKPSFEGIKQIIFEPESRVKIQRDRPEEKPDYLVIDRVEIKHDGAELQVIPFNQVLNTIIGGRSSGKSVLLGCIARLCGDKTVIKKNKPQYDKYIDSISNRMEIFWRDKNKGNRKIDFFPQSHIIEMASDPGKIRELVEDLMKDDDGKNIDLSILKGELETNRLVISYEFSSYRRKLEELKTLENDIKAIGNKEGIQQEISKLENNIENIKSSIDDGLSDEENEDYSNKKELLSQLNEKYKKIQRTINFINELSKKSIVSNLDDDFLEVQNDVYSENLFDKYNALKEEMVNKWSNIIASSIEECNNLHNETKKEIYEIENDPLYLKATKIFAENTKLVEESAKLEKEKQKIIKIEQLDAHIKQIKLNIYQILNNIYVNYMNFYSNQTDYCDEHIIKTGDVTITPRVVFQSEEFEDNCEKFFDARNSKNNIVYNYDYKNFNQFKETIDNIFKKFVNHGFIYKSGYDNIEVMENFFLSNPFAIEYNINYQGDDLAEMSEGKTAFVILRLLLDFSKNEYPILIDQPEDDLDNRAIFNDLVKYLREKKIKRQIILVTHNPNVVVGADAEEIIVANQHGIGNVNPDKVKFAYVTGALEETFTSNDSCVLLKQGIREHVCELLEGGDEAFKLREAKYQILKTAK